MATPSAPCRRARAACSTPPMSRCCSMWRACRFPRRAANRKRWRRWKLPRQDAAALIVEPLILGAGGMLIYAADVLREMAAHLRTPRHAVHRRRSDDRLRPHRHPVRLRAGRHRARHSVPGQGPDRRRAAAGGDPGTRGDLRGALFHRPQPHLFPFQFLHRQSDRLRRRARQSGNLARRAGARSASRPWRAWQEERLAPFRADPRFAQCPPAGHGHGAGPQSARSRLSGRHGAWN